MREKLTILMEDIRSYVFPEYYPAAMREEAIYAALADLTGQEAAEGFRKELPEIRRLVYSDVRAVMDADPATDSLDEVILCYQSVIAMLHYRTAHALLALNVKIIPRMLTEMAHSLTGIDIHPAAQIGERFAIDHGTGVVIGATTVIGNGVTLYQGVTLGARKISSGPRHPILEDDVTVYSNASILGRVTIGKGSVIGGNVWLTSSVPPYSRIVQGKAIYQHGFQDGEGI